MTAAPICLLWLLSAPLFANPRPLQEITGHPPSPQSLPHPACPWTCPWSRPWSGGARGPDEAENTAQRLAPLRQPTWLEGLLIAREPELTAPQPADAWFGEDKQRHLAMAFFITTIGHAGGRLAGLDAEPATIGGVAAAAAASLGKEIYDRRRGGPFSVKDLVWDAAGIALGAVLVRQTR